MSHWFRLRNIPGISFCTQALQTQIVFWGGIVNGTLSQNWVSSKAIGMNVHFKQKAQEWKKIDTIIKQI